MRFYQACSPRETRYSCAQGKSDGQPGPALGTACIDDAAAILGTHAGAKTVGALALYVAGLIGSFHVTLHPVVYSIKNHSWPDGSWQKRAQRVLFSMLYCQPVYELNDLEEGVDNFIRQV